MRRGFLALLSLAVALAAPIPIQTQAQGSEGKLLIPGPALESPMASGEKHLYRVAVKDDPVLVTVDQKSIDVVIEVHGPTGEELHVGGTGGRWGLEIVLLEGAGERGIEVRPMKKGVWPGHYTIAVETLSDLSSDGMARRQALSLMSRAAQEAFPETPEGRQKAAVLYREALADWRALEDRRWEAETLSSSALLAYRSRDLKQALADYGPALSLWRDLGDQRREALTLNDLGLTRRGTGDNQGAREAYSAAVALWEQLGDRFDFDEAETRTNLCTLEMRVGDPRTALVCFEEPLAIFQNARIQNQEQLILNNLGGIYDLLGEPDEALAHYGKSLELLRDLGDLRGEANSLNNIAAVHRALGEWQEALRLFDQAGEIVERVGDRSLEATLLLNRSYIYNLAGEPQKAVALLDKALKIFRENGDRPSALNALNNLGSARRKLGELDKALAHHREALELAVDLREPRLEAVTRRLVADVQIEQSDPQAALSTLEPALTYLKDSGLRIPETQALHTQARALTLAGRSQAALPILQEVLTRRRTLRDGAGEAEALLSLALAERSLGLQEAAFAHVEEAMDRVEALRTGFVSPGLRASFLATQRGVYSLLIDLLMDRHAAEPASQWDLAALEISEQARARTLLDALQAGSARRGGSAVPARLLKDRQSLRRRLSAKAYQQTGPGSVRAAALSHEIESLLADLDSVDAEIRRLEPKAAAFRRPLPLRWQEIAGLLDPGSLLLEYALGRERSYLWMVSHAGARSFVLPPAQEIDALARQVYQELSTVEAGATDRGEAAETLGRILLGPVWSEAARANRLVVVPDAALHFVPFAALPVPDQSRQPLLECVEVVYLPSATTLALSSQRLGHRPPAPKWAAIFADPVFGPDDARAKPIVASLQPPKPDGYRRRDDTDLIPVFERLPFSEREAKGIASLAPAGQVATSLGFEASLEAVLSRALRDYRIVHFATHGIANTRNPELSGLVLSQVDAARQPREGFLGLSDIYDLDLAADLVVLSGCDTALGKEVWGEGLMGLTRGFLYAGVPRVVASLWAVPDRAGAELMTRYYQAMWKDGLSPAAALRQAQLSLRRDPRYRGSYAWAGFVFQGEWL